LLQDLCYSCFLFLIAIIYFSNLFLYMLIWLVLLFQWNSWQTILEYLCFFLKKKASLLLCSDKNATEVHHHSCVVKQFCCCLRLFCPQVSKTAVYHYNLHFSVTLVEIVWKWLVSLLEVWRHVLFLSPVQTCGC
jgi:hypothetical protein